MGLSKHMASQHWSLPKSKSLGHHLKIKMSKAYEKLFTRSIEEGIYIANYDGIILNWKCEWHQPQKVRTKTTVIQVGADQYTGAGVMG